MRKLNVLFVMFVLVAVATVCMTGCESDSSALIGTWQLKTYRGETIPASYTFTLTIEKGGTGTRNENGTETSFTWTSTSTTLTVTEDGDTDDTQYVISGNTMITTDSDGIMTWEKI